MEIALIGALLTSLVSLILGLYNANIQYKKSKDEEPVRDASVTKTLNEASELVAKQYGELLDRVKKDFQERLMEIKTEVDSLKQELKIKDETISHLESENEKLKIRVAELETELKAWKTYSGMQ